MRYRREDGEGDYTFGSGDDTWLINSPEAVAQAVKTRFALWYGQWFLDKTEGTPWIQSVLGKQKPETYNLAIRKRILETRGVKSILSFNNTKHYSSGLPPIPWALIGMSQEWCNQYPPDILKPPDWCQICRC